MTGREEEFEQPPLLDEDDEDILDSIWDNLEDDEETEEGEDEEE